MWRSPQYAMMATERKNNSMFQYMKGKFWFPCADVMPALSFTVPEGCYLEDPPEASAEPLLCLRTPDRRWRIVLGAERKCAADTESELREIMRQCQTDYESDPLPIRAGTLNGSCAIYGEKQEWLYEVRLDVSAYRLTDRDGVPLERVMMILHADSFSSLRLGIENEIIRTILDGIQVR